MRLVLVGGRRCGQELVTLKAVYMAYIPFKCQILFEDLCCALSAFSIYELAPLWVKSSLAGVQC